MAQPNLTEEEISAYLSTVNAHRRRGQVLCTVCGQLTPYGYLTRQYCSNACSQKAKYARMKARRGSGPWRPWRPGSRGRPPLRRPAPEDEPEPDRRGHQNRASSP